MTDYSEKRCKICLRNNYSCIIVDGSQYISIFKKIFDVTVEVIELKAFWVCLWCKAILKKVKELIDVAKHPKILPDKTEIIHNLSFHHNSHVDIKPNHYNIEKDIIKEKIKKESNPISKNTNLKNELNIKLRKVEKHKLDELNFDIFYLSVDDQKKEIEDKKISEKYKQWSFKCENCGISFMFRDDYDVHKKRHDMNAGQHACNICKLRFKSTEVLSQHALAHKRRFECRTCGTKFKRWSHCVVHRVKCGTESAPAVCAVCAKIFGNHLSLKVHMKTVHERHKKYICDRCNKSFGTNQRLTVHIRSHTGFKPFSCKTCSKKFATDSNLRAHLKTHSDNKDHYCVECNKNYKTEKSLKRHFLESSKHTGDGRYSCKECSKKFTTEKILEKHLTSHFIEYRCVHCFKVFSNNANLQKHVRSIHNKTEA